MLVSIWGHLGQAVGLGLQGLSEARDLKGPLEAAFTLPLAGGKEGGGGGQRKLWAPQAGKDLERLQTIVSSGQAFSAGRGGLEVPLPPASHLVGWPAAAGRSSCGLG